MIIELTRFRVRADAEGRASEWMDFLRTNPEAFRQTLEPEQMYVETIFSEVLDGATYLYWYSVQGEDRMSVQESQHWLDKKHLEFWRDVIDPDFPPQELTPQIHMTPKRVEAAMRPLDGPHDATPHPGSNTCPPDSAPPLPMTHPPSLPCSSPSGSTWPHGSRPGRSPGSPKRASGRS